MTMMPVLDTRTQIIIYTTFCELYYFIYFVFHFICEHVLGSEICLNSYFIALYKFG